MLSSLVSAVDRNIPINWDSWNLNLERDRTYDEAEGESDED